VNDRRTAISPSLPPSIIASATSALIRSQQPGAARTKLLLEGPILPTLLRLKVPYQPQVAAAATP
jgi:hypothetical protein